MVADASGHHIANADIERPENTNILQVRYFDSVINVDQPPFIKRINSSSMHHLLQRCHVQVRPARAIGSQFCELSRHASGTRSI